MVKEGPTGCPTPFTSRPSLPITPHEDVMTLRSWSAVLRARLGHDERGFTMVEALASLTILAVGVFAVATAMGFGLKTSGMSRQRLAARAAAEQQMELARALNYESVVLDDADPLPHSSDPTHPDHWVDAAAQTFDPDADGPMAPEPIARVPGASPALHHVQSPFYSGNTRFEVYIYVTWVDLERDGTGAMDADDGNGDGVSDAGGHDAKRVTVAIRWQEQGGRWRVERMGSLFSDGKIPYHGTTGSAAPPTSSPSPSPSPTPSPTGTGPTGTLTIANGAQYTTSTIVTITLCSNDATEYQLSNDGATWGAKQGYSGSCTSTIYTLPPGDGEKTVWGRFWRNDTVGPATSDTIVLDTTPPNAPSGLTATRSSNKKTVTLSWSAPSPPSGDQAGYRVYRRATTGSTWVPVSCGGTGTTCTDDVSGQSGYQRTNYEYYVVAYDLAGNESAQSNHVTV